MKILSNERYTWIGIKDNWHVFVSKFSKFDPEVLHLYRAKMSFNDGSMAYFDPVEIQKPEIPLDVVLKGVTSEGNSYCMTVSVDSTDYTPVVSVSKPVRVRA
jgi:hypothetical protein